MLSKVLVLIAITLTDLTTKPGLKGLPAPLSLQEQFVTPLYTWWNAAASALNASKEDEITAISSLGEISAMLNAKDTNLQAPVINKVLTILQCSFLNNVPHNNILTIIDYSLPSNEKRLWVFDLKDKRMLFNTYVSHGITSGTLLTKFFSNKYNSKATSMGVFKTDQTYFGRDGLSLRLGGLDAGVNNNAANRYIVMHGGWYVSEDFIKKYGRPGRSWGCPAVPENIKEALINTIKGNSLLVAYYPSDNWLSKSKFLNCQKTAISHAPSLSDSLEPPKQTDNAREEVLFASFGKHINTENDAIVVMTADNYQRIFHNSPPLSRMLRRQIMQTEYVALSKDEFKNLVANGKAVSDNERKDALAAITLVSPSLKNVRGYFETQMQLVDTGRVLDANDNGLVTEKKSTLGLRPTNQFIRWLGL